jgi:hypothetical protein
MKNFLQVKDAITATASRLELAERNRERERRRAEIDKEIHAEERNAAS